MSPKQITCFLYQYLTILDLNMLDLSMLDLTMLDLNTLDVSMLDVNMLDLTMLDLNMLDLNHLDWIAIQLVNHSFFAQSRPANTSIKHLCSSKPLIISSALNWSSIRKHSFSNFLSKYFFSPKSNLSPNDFASFLLF